MVSLGDGLGLALQAVPHLPVAPRPGLLALALGGSRARPARPPLSAHRRVWAQGAPPVGRAGACPAPGPGPRGRLHSYLGPVAAGMWGGGPLALGPQGATVGAGGTAGCRIPSLKGTGAIPQGAAGFGGVSALLQAAVGRLRAGAAWRGRPAWVGTLAALRSLSEARGQVLEGCRDGRVFHPAR